MQSLGACEPKLDSAKPDISILIVSYNTREETLTCLASVYAQAQATRFEVILIDNASTDGSAGAIAAAFPEVRLIRSQENLGFAKANNLGAKIAQGRYLLLLNPDTVIREHAVERVFAFAECHPAAGIYGGRTYFGDGRLNRNSCHGRPTPWSLFCMGMGLSALFRRSQWFNPEGIGKWERNSARQVDCVSGCFLLIDRPLWDELGGFDLGFFMYGEDTDLCLRAAERGATCTIVPEAQLIHHGGRSERVRSDKMIRLFKAKRQLMEKHWRPLARPFGSVMLASWAGSRAIATTLMARLGRADPAAAAAWREIWRRRREFRNA